MQRNVRPRRRWRHQQLLRRPAKFSHAAATGAERPGNRLSRTTASRLHLSAVARSAKSGRDEGAHGTQDSTDGSIATVEHNPNRLVLGAQSPPNKFLQ